MNTCARHNRRGASADPSWRPHCELHHLSSLGSLLAPGLGRSGGDVVVVEELDKQQEVAYHHALAVPPLPPHPRELEAPRPLRLQVPVRVDGDDQTELQQLPRRDEPSRPAERTRVRVVGIHDGVHEAVDETVAADGEVVCQGGHGERGHVVEVVQRDHLTPCAGEEGGISIKGCEVSVSVT